MSKPIAFIVHGRDLDAVHMLAKSLRRMGLKVIPFEEHADRLGPLPVISDVVRKGIDAADLIVVLFTPDEHAALYDASTGMLLAGDTSGSRWQARPNVIFEAGWAFGSKPHETIFVSVGEDTTLFSDMAGHHVIRLDSVDGEERLKNRLEGIKTLGVRVPARWTPTRGFRDALARPRWRLHDELSALHASMSNQDLFLTESGQKSQTGARVRLIDVVTEVVAENAEWSWPDRKPIDLIRAILRKHNDFVADYAFWWLTSAGFFHFSDVEHWGDHWTDAIELADFAARGLAFLQWSQQRNRRAEPTPNRRRRR